jgi:hypothetical protein
VIPDFFKIDARRRTVGFRQKCALFDTRSLEGHWTGQMPRARPRTEARALRTSRRPSHFAGKRWVFPGPLPYRDWEKMRRILSTWLQR